MEEDIIKETQNVLNNGGNIIKTRDDRELILVDKDGNIQNADSCGWLPENDGKINKSVFRTRIEPWLTSLFQSEHLSLLCGSGITNAVSFLADGSGILVPREDELSLANAIETMIENKTAREKQATAGYKKAMKCFNKDHLPEQLQTLLDQLPA